MNPEEKERRRIEREELQATKRKYNRKSKDNVSDMSEPKNNTSSTENTGDDNSSSKSNNGNGSSEIKSSDVNNSSQQNGESGNGASTNTQTNTTTNSTTNTSSTSSQTVEKTGDGGAKQWNPMKGKRIHRDYSTPIIDQNLTQEIPEVNIDSSPNPNPNPGDVLNKPLEDAEKGTGTNTPAPQKPTPVNSEWNTMSPAEQQTAAELTTEMVLGVYDKLHYFGRLYIKVDEQEIIELHNEDKLDMNDPVMESDDDPDKEITIKEFWEDFNKQVDERFIVTEGFKDAVRPAMIRMCLKYGLGASDGLFLAFKFGEDLATKVAMMVGFKKTVNQMQEHFMKRHAKFKQQVEEEVKRRLAKEAANTTTQQNNGTQNQTTTSNSTTSSETGKDNGQGNGEQKNDLKGPTPIKDENEKKS